MLSTSRCTYPRRYSKTYPNNYTTNLNPLKHRSILTSPFRSMKRCPSSVLIISNIPASMSAKYDPSTHFNVCWVVLYITPPTSNTTGMSTCSTAIDEGTLVLDRDVRPLNPPDVCAVTLPLELLLHFNNRLHFQSLNSDPPCALRVVRSVSRCGVSRRLE